MGSILFTATMNVALVTKENRGGLGCYITMNDLLFLKVSGVLDVLGVVWCSVIVFLHQSLRLSKACLYLRFSGSLHSKWCSPQCGAVSFSRDKAEHIYFVASA